MARSHNRTYAFICPECRGGLDVEDIEKGECPDCGCTLSDHADTMPEVRSMSEYRRLKVQLKSKNKPDDDDPGPEAA